MDRSRSPCGAGTFLSRQPGSFLTFDSLQSDRKIFLRLDEPPKCGCPRSSALRAHLSPLLRLRRNSGIHRHGCAGYFSLHNYTLSGELVELRCVTLQGIDLSATYKSEVRTLLDHSRVHCAGVAPFMIWVAPMSIYCVLALYARELAFNISEPCQWRRYGSAVAMSGNLDPHLTIVGTHG
jgi:hypothetical protein